MKTSIFFKASFFFFIAILFAVPFSTHAIVATFGDEAVYRTADLSSNSNHVSALDNNRAVIASAAGGVAHALVATVSGDELSFGDPVNIHTLQTSNVAHDVVALSADTFVSASVRSTSFERRVGTVSDGDVISMGSPVTGSLNSTKMAALSDSVFLSASLQTGGDPFFLVRASTVSGSTITNGDLVDIGIEGFGEISIARIDSSRAITLFDAFMPNSMIATVVTSDGSTISAGTAYEVGITAFTYLDVVMLTTTKGVITYKDVATSAGKAILFNITNDDELSFSAPVEFSDFSNEMAVVRVTDDIFAIAFDYRTEDEGNLIVGEVSGSDITFDSPATFNDGVTYSIKASYLGQGKIVIVYEDDGNSNYGTAIVASVDFDSTAPTIETLSPADNATSVAADTNLVITFDEAVDAESGNISIYKSSDDSLVEAINVTSGQVTGSGSDTITINPSSDLDTDTDYYVLIDATAFDDTAENSFAGISNSSSWNFTTVDENGPVFSSISTTNTSDDTVSISWTSDELSSTQLEYGLSESYGNQTPETNTDPRVTSHSVSLSSLECGSTYHFLVKGSDALSNLGVSSDQTFATPTCPGPSGGIYYAPAPAFPTTPTPLPEQSRQQAIRTIIESLMSLYLQLIELIQEQQVGNGE